MYAVGVHPDDLQVPSSSEGHWPPAGAGRGSRNRERGSDCCKKDGKDLQESASVTGLRLLKP